MTLSVNLWRSPEIAMTKWGLEWTSPSLRRNLATGEGLALVQCFFAFESFMEEPKISKLSR